MIAYPELWSRVRPILELAQGRTCPVVWKGEGENGRGEAGSVVTIEPQWEVAPAVAPDSSCLFSSNTEPAECLSSKCLSPSLPPRMPRA